MGFPKIAHAENELTFSVQPKLPTSQLEDTTSYFDLNLDPGETEELVVAITNPMNDPLEVQIGGYTAYTNVNGVVEYGKESENLDETLSYELAELLEIPERKIEIAGKETREVIITLTMPDQRFEGLLAGGIRVEKVPEEQEEEDTGFAVKNAFAYVVGVVVSNERKVIEPQVNLTDVFANQLNYRNVFSATLQNETPVFINQLAVSAEVREKGGQEVLYASSAEGMQMAPNSHFDFPISLDGERFKDGTYIADIEASSGDNQWVWEYEFTIDQKTARKLNKTDVTIEDTTNWWLIVAWVAISLLVLASSYFIYSKKKGTVQSKKKHSNKRTGSLQSKAKPKKSG